MDSIRCSPGCTNRLQIKKEQIKMNTYHKSTPAYKDWIFWTLCVATAVVFYFALTFKGHGQETNLTNGTAFVHVSADSPPATPAANPTPVVTEQLTPQIVEQHLYAWGAVLVLVGGFIRHYVGHFVVWVAPWAKANGGLLRGVFRFFWDSATVIQPPKLVLPVSSPSANPPE
jgi:hypothetical protein